MSFAAAVIALLSLSFGWVGLATLFSRGVGGRARAS